MKLQGKTVGIVGLGKSGLAAARTCMDRGANVVGFDERAGAEVDVFDVIVGPLDAERLSACDLIVVSPGVPQRDALDAAEQGGVEVIGELELASRFLDAPIALIGGTNGKSTVTALVAAMLGDGTFIGGNFGTPLCDAIGSDGVAVVEISSFQAERIPTLRAKVHALLNISEDHLDRYADFAAYAHAKGNPFANMTAEDVAVIPADDEAVAKQAARGGAWVVTFSGDGDVVESGSDIVDRRDGLRWPRALLKISGRHNLSNACAAIAVARVFDASHEAIADALSSFAGLPHRAVRVATHAGVHWYDDSKATNVGAAVAALRGLDEARAVLIAGGRDKHGAYEPLVEALHERGRALVVLGEAADRIAHAAAGAVPIVKVASMDEAVATSAELACEGDAVLLSPACSSFDMYGSFAARGDDFARAVKEHIAS